MQTSTHNNRNTSPLAERLSAFGPISSEALARLDGIDSCSTFYEAGQEILTEGDEERAAWAVKSGWGCLYKILDDGRRQIFSFVLPGDVINTQPGANGVLTWSFAALTDIEVSRFKPRELEELRRTHSRASAALDAISGLAFDMLAERLMSIGRRTAYERLAHLLVELYARFRAVGLGNEDGFELPLNQEMIGDAMGLSTVHVSRTFKKLRQAGIVDISRKNVDILDFDSLLDAAGLDCDFVERLCPFKAENNSIEASTSQIPAARGARRGPDGFGATVPQAA